MIYARLKSGFADEVLFIHADQKLPETYLGFQDEQQLSHALSMVVSLPSSKVLVEGEQNISFSFEQFSKNLIDNMPSSLLFSHWFNSAQQEMLLATNSYNWSLEKHV